MRTLLVAALLPLFAIGKDLPVADQAELDAAIQAAEPGDSIVLREGTWVDLKIRFVGKGSSTSPITLRSAVPGKTILTGKSQIRISGEYLTVDGLWIKDPDPSVGDTVEFRADSKSLARHCRLTNSAVTMSSGSAASVVDSRWVNLYGSDNRVDHCFIEGKNNGGTTLVVWLGNGQEGRHRIDGNYFGAREPLGRNGGETIRVGDSKTSMQPAACVIEKNLFERCDGEAECISNKSCGNVYRGNSFVAVSGALTLRHGNGCTVEENIFHGESAKGTGGIRIIGEDHIVRRNFLSDLAGDDARSGITLMMGIPDSPAHGYFQVKRARIENNVLVNCRHPILIGLSNSKNATLPPIDTVFADNVVTTDQAVVEARCATDGLQWEGNSFWGKELGIPKPEGVDWRVVKVERQRALTQADVGPAWWGDSNQQN